MKNPEKAKSMYELGFNCCQSVLSTYAPDFMFDKDISMRLVSGFAAGMAYQGKTCGAVIGAYMVIGLLKGSTAPDNEYSKDITYGIIREFNSEFIKINNSLECRELLGKDVTVTEDMEYILCNKLFDINCPKYVAESCRILDKLLVKYKNGE